MASGKQVTRFGALPRHLRLHIPQVPRSYRGRLYFILGPGLGDTVNDFRILHEVMELYPDAKAVVYADPRWKDLYELAPDLRGLPIRYHPQAPSGELQSKQEQKPYYQTFQHIIQEICADTVDSSGLVALGSFKCPDQLARKEPTIRMKARAIGLSLPPERCRPFLPLSEDQVAEAQQFLRARGLVPGCYLAVAPHSFSDKMWPYEAWEILIAELQRSTNLPTLVVGVPGYCTVRGPDVHEALGLPLPVVAGLLCQARCYIGLDSGLTHLAACFDVPLVTLNPQGKFPPFLVEPHSPFRWTCLSPGVYGNALIPPACVFEVVHEALKRSHPPPCLVCAADPYVLGAKEGSMLFLCRCGLMYRERRVKQEHQRSRQQPGADMILPTSEEGLATFRTGLANLKEQLRLKGGHSVVSFAFEHWDPVGIDPMALLTDPSPRDLWWNWDSGYQFVTQSGLQVTGSHLEQSLPIRAATFRALLQAVPARPMQQDVTLEVPWGRTLIRVRRTIYERWLSWSAFRKQEELEGIGWLLVLEAERKIGRHILRIAFTLRPRAKTLGRLIRVWWMELGRGMAKMRLLCTR